MYIGYLWESQKERDHKENIDVGLGIILRWIFRKIRWGELD
jgi:hypothetical protein